MSSAGEYARVFKDLRDGVLLLLVTYVIAAVVVVAFFVVLFTTLFGFATPSIVSPRNLAELLFMFGGAFLALITGFLVCVIIALIAVYAKILPGVSRLARLDPEYSTPSTLMRIGYYIGLPLVALGLLVLLVTVAIAIGARGTGLLFTGLVAGGGIALVGGILLFIAFIGIIVLCFKLAEREGLSEYKIAGILFIAGLVLAFIPYVGVARSLLDLVAWILLYVTLSRSYRKYVEKTQPTSSLQFSPSPPSL